MKKQMVKGLIATAVGMACFSNSALAEEITVWAWDPNFNIAIMEQAAEEYKKTNPDTTFKIVDFAKADVEQKLHTMLASGVTSALPDIVLIEDYNAQKYLQSYPGSFAPMTDAVDYSQFAPYKVSLMTVKDEVYGLPFDTGVTGMYYRTDILEKAGFTAKDMENITWQRFVEIGKQVKEKTGISMLGTNPDDLGLVRVMMQSGGEWYFNNDGSLNIKDNESLKESLQLFKDLLNPDVSRPTIGWSEWVGSVNRGQVATITTGVWITASVEAGKDQSGSWAIAPTPRLSSEQSVNSSNLGGSSWYVLNASDEKQEAIKFLNQTFGTNAAFYETILKDRGAVGSYMPASESDAYQYSSDFFSGQKIYSDFSNWLVQVPEVNYGMYTYEVDAALSSMLPAIVQGAPIEKVLADVEQQLQFQLR
ncbi:extracellular solute-binding protein [Vibrio sp. T187]|uniref:ABC transporter substrate-binding protein n=1 Tax=Vibrio TaxID=662 RepID=UPI0010C9AE6E|nr:MULTISPECIES: extracellular solute-binding protein [Vibrio]MBW3694256.1 extracellular solute-binding protein [Vibrio sp. T187]